MEQSILEKFFDENKSENETKELQAKSTKVAKTKKKIDAENTQKEIFDEEEFVQIDETSIEKNTEHIILVEDDLPPSYLIDVKYDGEKEKAYLKFFNPRDGKVYRFYDKTDHKPYFLTTQTIEEVENKLAGDNSYIKSEKVKKSDLLRKKDFNLTKIIASNPLAIGGRGESYRDIIIPAFEANIRYHLNYIYDLSLTPGLLYKIERGEIKAIKPKIEEEKKEELLAIFKDQPQEITNIVDEYLSTFFSSIPKLRRCSLDIEVKSTKGRIPDPNEAKDKIISIGFADTENNVEVFVLNEEENAIKLEDSSIKVVEFKEEEEMLQAVFEKIANYPVILTFNGDNFDLPYLHKRAKNLGVNDSDIPIIRTSSIQNDTYLEYGLHIDLYRFFRQASMRIYAFGGKYDRVTLDELGSSLLGKEKIKLEKDIWNLRLEKLIEYNARDAIITLELTTFNQNQVMEIIFMLSRLTKMPIDDFIRSSVSIWIQNWLYFEHRQRDYLIPRQQDILQLKGETSTEAMIKGKKYQGAIVIEPQVGVWWDVHVLDFACYSEDTEILTDKGWLSFPELKKSKNKIQLATVNTKSNQVEFLDCEEIYEYPYDGEMFSFRNKNSVDLLVTPNHRMVFNRRTNDRKKTTWRKKLEVIEAEKLSKRSWFKIPQFGNWQGKSKKIMFGDYSFEPEEFLPFLGWFLTNGSIAERNIIIHQSKKKNFQNIRDALEKTGFGYKENIYEKNGKKYRNFTINDAEFRRNFKEWLIKEKGLIKREGKYSKRIPRVILEFEKEHLELIFKTMILGDGSWINGKCYSLSSINKDFANDFQELVLRLGFGSSISKEKRDCVINGRKYIDHVSYRCFISYSRKNVFNNQHKYITKENYTGKVWCVSNLNGTVIVRRNGKPAVSGNSLYPSIIKTRNLSYETMRCEHEECKKENKIPETNHWVCTKSVGIISMLIGFIRDVRVYWFKQKAKDSKLTQKERNLNDVIQSSLKVLINACLPYDEEIIIKNKQQKIEKIKIGELGNRDWKNYEVLSVDKNKESFGKPMFVPLLNFMKNGKRNCLVIKTADGKILRCTEDHIVPKLKNNFEFQEVEARELKENDNIMVCNNVPLITKTETHLFLPDFMEGEFWIGLTREEYKKYSYRRNQKTHDKFLQLVNKYFSYSKSSKIYKIKWSDIPNENRDLISKQARKKNILIKIHEKVGHWYPAEIKINCNFMKLLGYYVAEGSISLNRFTITQYKKNHPMRYKEIGFLVEQLAKEFNTGVYKNEEGITLHSNVLSMLFEKLCGKGAHNKRIPLFLMNKKRAKTFLNTYFKGDGRLETDGRKCYTTASEQLKNDLVYLLNGIGKFVSVQFDEGVYRIIETKGRHYKRKHYGMVESNGTTIVRIKEIIKENKQKEVFDITTENGWFVTTNGFVVHNCYGVLGSDNFALYCPPVAESTTALAREAISKTKEHCEQDLGISVLYGDTDSIFIHKPKPEDIEELKQWSLNTFQIELGTDYIFRYCALSERKKNYFGISTTGKPIVKGLMGKKKNTPDLIRGAFDKVIQILREVKDDKELKNAKKKIVKVIQFLIKKIEKRNFNLEELAISVTLSKRLKAYDSWTQPLQAAIQLIIDDPSKEEEISSGSNITFIKTKSFKINVPSHLINDKLSSSDECSVKPIELAEPRDVDLEKMKELVQSTFIQLLDTIGIPWREVQGIKAIDSFFG